MQEFESKIKNLIADEMKGFNPIVSYEIDLTDQSVGNRSQIETGLFKRKADNFSLSNDKSRVLSAELRQIRKDSSASGNPIYKVFIQLSRKKRHSCQIYFLSNGHLFCERS